MPTDFRIVTLCGSAGALPAYVKILEAMPVDNGMAFVVLTHRRKGTPCWLVDILSRATRMQVREIAEGCVFEPNHVYVIPAGEDLTMDGAAFSLVPATTVSGWPDAFDIYLDSVAKTTHERAVTVILSGMSEDGSAALKDLRKSGGLNYVQSDASSRGMPESAVRTGMVDYIGSPEEIASEILGLPEMGRIPVVLDSPRPLKCMLASGSAGSRRTCGRHG